MPLQSSGAISFSQIRGEFGGAGVTRMGQLYVNAGVVPNDGFVTNGTIPASGPIRFSNFYSTTDGNTYFTYTSPGSYTATPPVNARRCQIRATGSGGGGCNSTLGLLGGTAAGGGGGGCCQSGTLNCIRDNGDYVTVTVGNAGTGLNVPNSYGNSGTAGTGGASQGVVRNSAGTALSVITGIGGGGGRAGQLGSNVNPVGGAGGSGCAENGSAGAIATTAGGGGIAAGGNSGDAENRNLGKGGNGFSPVAGNVGRVRIRF